MSIKRAVVLHALLAVGAGAQSPVPPPASPQPKVDRSPKPGIGDLMVAPQRLILEGRQRTEEIFLVNHGPRTATYRVSFIQMEMGEDGTLSELSEKRPGGKYADDLIRYSPRQVTLEPGVAQTIRVSVRKPEGLAKGEYRSHLILRAVPEPEAQTPGLDKADPTGISVRLTAIYGVAIPVIVRHETTPATVAWESTRMIPGAVPTLEAVLARTGGQSVYGDLKVYFTPTASEPILVSQLNWVALYDGLARRQFKLPLNLPTGKASSGTLRIVFFEPETTHVLAETRLEIR